MPSVETEPSRLLPLLPRLRRSTVVVLGDLVADEYVYGETDRVSREAPVPVVRHESTEVTLGGAANAAANVASLGAAVRPVGVVGRDATGRELIRLFQEQGAETRGILAVTGRLTETKTRILAGGRSTTRQQLLRVDRTDARPLSAAARRTLRTRLREACEGAGAIIVSDYGSGLVDESMREELSALAERIPVCVDSRYGLTSFRGITLAKPNEPELEAITGVPLRTRADVERAARRLMEILEAKAVLVTRGRLGMCLVPANGPLVEIPVFGPAEAVDVTGAGDTVLATVASALAGGASLENAARLANVAGGLVVQKPGTATCSVRELKSALGSERETKPHGRSVSRGSRRAVRSKGKR